MAAFILTMILSLFLGGIVWFAAGSRFAFSDEEDKNDLLNFGAFFAGAIPLSFVVEVGKGPTSASSTSSPIVV